MSVKETEYEYNREIVVRPVGRGAAAAKNSVNLSFGFPATELLPVEALNRAAAESLNPEGADALHYTGGKGVAQVQEWQLNRLRKFGIEAEAENYLAVYGAGQGIELAARVLLNPGDTVWTEAPSFFNALDAFRHAGAKTVGLRADKYGLDVDQVEKLLRSAEAAGAALPKLIYVIPNFQNPAGTTLPADRRQKLAALARTYHLFILEDDAYGELRYEGHDLPSVYSFAPERVIYLTTFSKTLGPGLRLGTVIAPLQVAERLRVLTLNSPPTPFTLEIVGCLLQTYDYDAQISRLRDCYRARRDFMAECLAAEFEEAVSLHVPEGGFFLWLSFKENVSALKIARLAKEQGVLVVPGEQFFAGNQAPAPFLRLCFSYSNEQEIARGVRALAAAYRLLIKG
ncbi:aminotransferase-like domain-containing protein [Paenibacillus sp. FSL R7-0179]|uniref:aminotransferase-like domain-containing protein n=1 Tax=Paenibacillus sp. FSL R7-0179 TaxID=2921672 RepID=UPI0030F8250F